MHLGAPALTEQGRRFAPVAWPRDAGLQSRSVVDIIVRGKHFAVPDHIDERARTKLGKLPHYLPLLEDAAIEVDLAHEKAKEPAQRFLAHVTVSAHGVHLQAQERAAKPERAVDLAAQVLMRQARQHKERLYKRGRGSGVRAGAAKRPVAKRPAKRSPDGAFARVKQFPVELMTRAEALAQMKVLGHDFFLYCDADLDQVAVVYRRRAGDYGLIVPELP
jgi:putative sigma-54 modulation protein